MAKLPIKVFIKRTTDEMHEYQHIVSMVYPDDVTIIGTEDGIDMSHAKEFIDYPLEIYFNGVLGTEAKLTEVGVTQDGVHYISYR